MPLAPSLCRTAMMAVLIMPNMATAQDADAPSSKTEAVQIGQRDGGTTAGEAARRVFLEEAPAAPRAPASLMQDDVDQIDAPEGADMAPQQLTSIGEGAPAIPQLSGAELEAALAQLTPTERSVLLQAIEGTDICIDPPAVAAVIALCRSRLETRSGEFAAKPELPPTSEERLLRDGGESNGLPTVEAVISRLSRVTLASSDDFNNQAIASIALAPPPVAESRGKEDDPVGLGLGAETDALINAIVEQLGGPGGSRP